MPLVEPIRIENLRELQAAMRRASEGSQKQLRVVFNAAAETVAGGARRRVPSRTGRARASLKAMSGQREGKAVGGGGKAPYYGWLDFGGRVGRRRSVERRFVEGGRYLYPSYVANRRSILESLAEAIAAVARDAGLDVT